MKRPIAAIALDGLSPAPPPTGKPELTWIAPNELLIDEAYQRDLSQASLRLIRRIVERWDWRRFKPPVVAWTAEGLEVIDGQHSAIAAETHPAIDLIPVIVVEAAQQVDRAQAFIGHNRDRIAITAAQMHAASSTAGDADALQTNRICVAAGVEMLRIPPARGVYRPRTTIAVTAVKALVVAEPEDVATWVLRTLAEADLAPIGAAHIRALWHLVTTEEFAEVDRDALARAVQATPIKAAEQEAKEHAAVHCVPAWRGLAAVWFRTAKKQARPPARTTKPSRASFRGITIPDWVPDDLVEDFRDIALMEGEEIAASKVRRMKREANA